ncbi:AraC family transcriptional regulator [Trujillonella humicola]|uniref:AraC family transcriptional regulator n=1 Tax=Trujillonella humicola TaxID=3383699 RepID=UPI0039060300
MDRLVRLAALTGYREVALSLGLDPARLMTDEGLDIGALADPDHWVPAIPVTRLLERSAAESGCEDFALRMVRYRRLSALGPLSVVVREEPDLRSALDLLIRYERAYTGVVDLRLVEADGLATVQVWLDFGAPVPVRQFLDGTAAVVVNVIRSLARADWQPLSVSFAHGPPADATLYHQVFGPGLRFEQPFTGVVFPAHDLELPSATADPRMREYTTGLLATVPAPRPVTPSEQVRSIVEILLPTGRCSLLHVSRSLDVPPRTLRRHLAEDGETFSTIVHATRVRWAERYLANDAYSLTQIAHLLGFAASSAFSVWFRGHFGTTATEWRHRTRSAPIRRPVLEDGLGDRG